MSGQSCNLQARAGKLHGGPGASRSWGETLTLTNSVRSGTIANLAHRLPLLLPRPEKFVEKNMDLALWLPALFLLGLVAFALIFGFVFGCGRV